jgi:hypothetical protein
MTASADHVDALARHLALLLSVADLSARLAPAPDEAAALADLAGLVRRATGADRASVFEIEGADADEGVALSVVRRARDADVAVDPVATFSPRSVALLLAPLGAASTEALCPIDAAEPFYARHLDVEPSVPRAAAFAPIIAFGKARGVLEIARSDDRAFRGDELRALESGARAVAAGVYGLRREATVLSLFTAILPELLDPAHAPTSLPDRLRAWLSTRAIDPDERRALALATTIAELSRASGSALELVQTVLSATRKAFARDIDAWSEVSRGPR